MQKKQRIKNKLLHYFAIRGKAIHLTSTLSHFSSLATKTTHSLLAPLGSHTTVQVEMNSYGLTFNHTLLCQRARSLEIVSSVSEDKGLRRVEGTVAHGLAELLNTAASGDRHAEGAAEGSDQQLHTLVASHLV